MTKQTDKQQQTQELLDFQAKLKSLHEVSGELSQTDSFDDFCRLAVELGCSRLGFDRLGLWFVDTDPRFIIGSFGIDEQGQIRDERGQRHELLPMDDVSVEMLKSESRRSVRLNIPLLNDKTETVGFGDRVRGNLWDGDRLLGWLSADNLIRQEPWSHYQIELLGLYAASLGHLIARKRTEEALRAKEEGARQFQEKLKALHEVSFELSKTHSFDDLCLRAVELGRSKLGFDRLGLWFLDSDPEFMVGSFGIDEHGQVRDERKQRLPVRAGEYMQELLAGRVFAATRNDVPIYNDCYKIVGTGWKAVAQMWDGDQNIGWVSVDNLLSRQPPADYELELLSLYATTLGHLAAVRRTEETLAAERTLLRTIIDAVPDFIYVKDTEGRLLLVNKACQEDTPQVSTEAEMLGKTDFDFFSRDYAEQFWADDQQVLTSGMSIKNVEEPGRSKDGQARTILTTKVPLKDTHDRVIGLVGVSHDITDLKRIERQALELAVERERVNVLRESITSISHDLRTPLSIINSSLYLLEHITDPEMQKDKLQSIKLQTALLEQRIEEILLSARLENTPEVSRSPVNFSRLVASILQSLYPIAERRHLTIVTDLQFNLPDVLGDQTEFERILDNLIRNAIAYTPDGGSIELRTFVQDNRVGVEVSDTGIGISEDDLPYIFDHFFRVDKSRSMDKRGMGLGLAIVKRIVEMHDGTIEVESTVGQGSLFRVLLPTLPEN